MMTRRLLAQEVHAQHFTEVLRYLEAAGEPTVTDRPPEQYVNVPNGLLDWRTDELVAHTPDVVSTVQLPVAWRAEAECPGILRFLHDVLPEDGAVDLILETGGAVRKDHGHHDDGVGGHGHARCSRKRPHRAGLGGSGVGHGSGLLGGVGGRVRVHLRVHLVAVRAFTGRVHRWPLGGPGPDPLWVRPVGVNG